MKWIVRFIKRIFGVCEPECEYWVRTKDIKVPDRYKKSKMSEKKWKHKLNYYYKTGELESKILLDKNFNLKDGFSSVKIAHLEGIDKVPVYFVD